MCHGVTNVVLILSILLCPLYCGEGHDAAAATSPPQSLNDCCGCGGDRSTDDEQNGPTPCHDGCGKDCVCKGLLEGHVKLLLACDDFWLPVCGEHCVAMPASLTVSPAAIRTRGPTHPDLCSGVAIRLAFASLLL